MLNTSQSESELSAVEENKGSKKPDNTRMSNRRKFACVECRQQKSKCDAYEKAPEPCSKCAKKGVPCILQKDFRRTYKRARNEAIEKRFKELTRTLTDLSSEEILQRIKEEQMALLDNRNFTKEKIKEIQKVHQSNFLTGSDRNSASFTTQHVPSIRTSSSSPNWCSNMKHHTEVHDTSVTSEYFICTPKTLGDIHMSSETIADLFQEFALKYHTFLPIVDLSKGAERIYTLSPCLFWVILLIGLRRKPGAIDLMTKLSVFVKSVLSEITISPIIRYTPSDNDEPVLNVASVYSVQAFLLYTFWPPLTSSLSADTSWNTIGTATFQAVRVGLNCAEFSEEYANENSELISEKVKTWVCCNVVSQFVASSFGFPAYVSFDHTVMNAAKIGLSPQDTRPVPLSISQMAQIAHFENQMINTMNSNPANFLGRVGTVEKQPLLKVLNQQLTHLEMNLKENNVDNIRKFLLLVAKVHLLTFYFSDTSSIIGKDEAKDETASFFDIESNFETKRGLVRAYNATIDLLSHASNMWKLDPTIIKYFPGVFVLNIWQSACVISKLVHSSLSSVIDVERGKKVYQDAVSLTFNASVLKHDMAYRSSGIMKSIWSMFSNMYDDWKKRSSNQNEISNDFNLDISINSRMSVSVFFDCLYILREKCGMARIKRERQRDQEIFDDQDEDGVASRNENYDDYEKPETRERRLSSNKHPEENARKIIKTIPLDPNPINAANNSGGSSLASPSSQATEVLSLEGMLNKGSPRDELGTGPAVLYTDQPVNYISQASPGIPLQNNIRATSSLSVKNFKANSNLSNNSTAVPTDTLTTVAQVQQRNQEDIAVDLVQQPNNHLASESPHNLADHWENWESDTVWKDVDLLMNEFAFNPTV